MPAFFFERGYGNSEGFPSEAGLGLDGLASIDAMLDRDDIDSSRIILFGLVTLCLAMNSI